MLSAFIVPSGVRNCNAGGPEPGTAEPGTAGPSSQPSSEVTDLLCRLPLPDVVRDVGGHLHDASEPNGGTPFFVIPPAPMQKRRTMTTTWEVAVGRRIGMPLFPRVNIAIAPNYTKAF